jgi:hypothetical protein
VNQWVHFYLTVGSKSVHRMFKNAEKQYSGWATGQVPSKKEVRYRPRVNALSMFICKSRPLVRISFATHTILIEVFSGSSTWKERLRKRTWPNRGIIPGETEENHGKSIRIAVVPAMIRIRYLPNVSLRCYKPVRSLACYCTLGLLFRCLRPTWNSPA